MEGARKPIRIAIIGGGAAGVFAAISAVEADPTARVSVFEKSSRFLSKVKISGGGRCNVTHACFEPKELVTRYPRGSKELLGPFYSWQPSDMVEWLESKGVELKTESDGRMFPVTDSSQTIIDCLIGTAKGLGIKLESNTGITRVQRLDTGAFRLTTAKTDSFEVDRLILATGGGRDAAGHGIARSLGHSITTLAPSLFTFHIKSPLIAGLQGLSVPNAAAECPSERLTQNGPLLITHWGLSGPAILKLSAWGARRLAHRDYKFDLKVNWTGTLDFEAAKRSLLQAKQHQGAKQIGPNPLLGIPRRLWERFLQIEQIDPKSKLSQLTNPQLHALAKGLVACPFEVTGKSMNKEEFVTCGGVSLSEVDFKRMESKMVPNLHFAGETLDIDGVTGGFNFQAAWTTGHIAGASSVERK